jgi:hypothetical protein
MLKSQNKKLNNGLQCGKGKTFNVKVLPKVGQYTIRLPVSKGNAVVSGSFIRLFNFKIRFIMALKKEDLAGVPFDTLSKNKKGNYVIRQGFYYRNGRSQHIMEEKLKDKFPNVEVIDKGEKFVDFRGGDNIEQGSHFWVEFKIDFKS